MIRALTIWVSAFIASASIAGAAQANCRLALLLAVDVSSSVSDEEYRLQQSGLAAALMAPDVVHAILGGSEGHVSLAIYEWSGRNQQRLVLGWQTLQSRDDIRAAASVILNTKRSFSKFPTSMGFSLGYGAGLFRDGPRCDRKVIDVSGDGINNDGFSPRTAYRHFPFKDVTVNGLIIEGSDPDVEWFYEREVLWGAGAFLEVAQGFDDFERTMTRKLYREINNMVIGQAPAPRQTSGLRI